jgi:hypothetical protein
MNLKTGLIVPLILLGGVASAGVRTRPDIERAAVSVTNQNPLDVDVFIAAGSARTRLGTVVTGQTQSFELPAAAVSAGQVRMVVDPVGARDSYVSEPLSIADGDQINLRVGARLAQSSATVERGAAR